MGTNTGPGARPHLSQPNTLLQGSMQLILASSCPEMLPHSERTELPTLYGAALRALPRKKLHAWDSAAAGAPSWRSQAEELGSDEEPRLVLTAGPVWGLGPG